MILLLQSAGVLLVLLTLLHLAFPRYFRWKETLRGLPQISREVMYVHTFFIGLTVLLMGALCLTSAEMMLSPGLGRRICLGLGIFWAARLVIQFFGYSPELWRGKRFETCVHVAFALLWTFLAAVFFVAAASIG